MKKSYIVLIAVIAIIVLIGGSLASGYNGLITSRENVQGKWSQVETQMQRRADLIPNLVSTVKGYAAHESGVYQDVADARAKLAGANTISEKVDADEEVTTALSRLLMVVESYPNLKANENFIALQDELAGTENRLAVARKDYNDSVQSYNASIKKFPTNILAGVFNFTEFPYYKADEGSDKAPTVDFSNN